MSSILNCDLQPFQRNFVEDTIASNKSITLPLIKLLVVGTCLGLYNMALNPTNENVNNIALFLVGIYTVLSVIGSFLSSIVVLAFKGSIDKYSNNTSTIMDDERLTVHSTIKDFLIYERKKSFFIEIADWITCVCEVLIILLLAWLGYTFTAVTLTICYAIGRWVIAWMHAANYKYITNLTEPVLLLAEGGLKAKGAK